MFPTIAMMKSVLQLCLLLFTSVLSAQSYLPTSTTGQIIEHTNYTLSYSEPHEQAEWVYYELTSSMINGSKGLAKSTGLRCKNMTTNANGLCHLHQDQLNGVVKQNNVINASSGRCQAITQAGTQCKRQAEAGSRYCWQHKK